MQDNNIIQNAIDYIKKLQKENTELKAENDRLKAEITELEEKFLTLNGKSYSYHMTLQEIKEYAESIGNEEMISGYAIRAKSALWRIANMITKAESEG